MKRFLAALLLLGATLALGAKPATSPNGKLSVKTADSKLVISYEKQTVLEMADVPFKKLKFVRRVKDDYRMLEGKRLHCTNQAKEYQAPIGPNARIVMRVYDDVSDNASYACSNYKTCAPNGNANDYSSDWIWKLEKTGVFSFNDGPLRFSKTLYYDRDDSRCPSWEYVYGKVYGDTTNERILGRYAYVAIGMNDQLNPNALGRRNYPDFDNSMYQKRLGRWTCEPQFIFRSTRHGWNFTQAIYPDKIRDKYPSDGWQDLEFFHVDVVLRDWLSCRHRLTDGGDNLRCLTGACAFVLQRGL